jgi:hypothetical protein
MSESFSDLEQARAYRQRFERYFEAIHEFVRHLGEDADFAPEKIDAMAAEAGLTNDMLMEFNLDPERVSQRLAEAFRLEGIPEDQLNQLSMPTFPSNVIRIALRGTTYDEDYHREAAIVHGKGGQA